MNIKHKLLILSFFFLLSGCSSVSDILEKDETGVEPIDEVGQLLSDIQEEEESSTLPEINDEPALELSEEKLDAISQSSARKGIDLDTKTKEFIINNTSRSLSDLLQLLNDIDVFSLQKKKKVNPYLIRQLLKVRSGSPHK